jgi:hypothetical protein
MESKFKVGDRVRHVLGHEGVIESAQTDSIKVKVTYYKPRTSGRPPKTRTQRTAFGRKIKSPNFYDDLYINYKIKEDEYILPSWRVVESESEKATRLIKKMQETPLTLIEPNPCYYEEETRNGRQYFRITPNGDWMPKPETVEQKYDRAGIAAMAMAGMLAGGLVEKSDYIQTAERSVTFADVLIAELQRTEK